MEYIFIFAAFLLLIGSISIALPSKASKKISKVRMDAKLLGCKISSTLYGENKFKNQYSLDASYQIKNKTNLRDAHFVRDKEELILYSPVKLKYSDSFEGLNFDVWNNKAFTTVCSWDLGVSKENLVCYHSRNWKDLYPND